MHRRVCAMFVLASVLHCCMHTCVSVHMESAFGCTKSYNGVSYIWNVSYIDYFKGLHIRHKEHDNKSGMFLSRNYGHWHQSQCGAKSNSDNVPISKNKHRKGHDRNRLWRTNIFIGGLFDLNGSRRPSGISELTAAKVAVAHINKRNILPGYRLRLLYNDTEVSEVCFVLLMQQGDDIDLVSKCKTSRQ